MPYKWYPGTRVLDQAFLWRLLDLDEADGRPIDRVIATKFPAYCVRHPNKVAWVTHQFRQAYDYDRSPTSGSSPSRPRIARRARAVERLDRVALGEARKVFAISQNVVDRLERFTDVDATLSAAAAAEAAVPHGRAGVVRPLRQPARPCEADRPADRGGEARPVAADRDHRRRARPRPARAARLAAQRPGRVHGRVDDERLADLYARCLAVFYAPVDEDYGMVPFEAFLSEKPVVTTTDAGGPLEIVHDRETGVVVAPDARRGRARRAPTSAGMSTRRRPGAAPARRVAERVTWDACVDALLCS